MSVTVIFRCATCVAVGANGAMGRDGNAVDIITFDTGAVFLQQILRYTVATCKQKHVRPYTKPAADSGKSSWNSFAAEKSIFSASP